MAILPLYAGERGDIDGRGRNSLVKQMRRRLLEARHGALGSPMGLVAAGSILLFIVLVVVLTVHSVGDDSNAPPHHEAEAAVSEVRDPPR